MTSTQPPASAAQCTPRRTHEVPHASPLDIADKRTSGSTDESPSDTEQLTALVDDHGVLDPAVWETVDLYLNHAKAKGNFSAVGRLLGLAPSAVSRRYDKWLDLMNEIAATKAGEQRPSTSAASEDNTPDADSTDDTPQPTHNSTTRDQLSENVDRTHRDRNERFWHTLGRHIASNRDQLKSRAKNVG